MCSVPHFRITKPDGKMWQKLKKYQNKYEVGGRKLRIKEIMHIYYERLNERVGREKGKPSATFLPEAGIR